MPATARTIRSALPALAAMKRPIAVALEFARIEGHLARGVVTVISDPMSARRTAAWRMRNCPEANTGDRGRCGRWQGGFLTLIGRPGGYFAGLGTVSSWPEDGETVPSEVDSALAA